MAVDGCDLSWSYSKMWCRWVIFLQYLCNHIFFVLFSQWKNEDRYNSDITNKNYAYVLDLDQSNLYSH